jgi:hypothetical protein
MTVLIGTGPAIEYVESVNFTEPMFVFAIMTVAATRPVIDFSVIPPREMVEPQRTQRAPRRLSDPKRVRPFDDQGMAPVLV